MPGNATRVRAPVIFKLSEGLWPALDSLGAFRGNPNVRDGGSRSCGAMRGNNWRIPHTQDRLAFGRLILQNNEAGLGSLPMSLQCLRAMSPPRKYRRSKCSGHDSCSFSLFHICNLNQPWAISVGRQPGTTTDELSAPSRFSAPVSPEMAFLLV
jgi:hypothetical protein